jgi:hypothetical protein
MGMPRLTNETYFKFSILFLLFLLLVFDRDMAMIYILIMVGDFIWYRFDTKITFPLEKRTDNRLSSLLEVGIATAAFFAISTAAIKIFAVQLPANFQSVISLLATATPVLAGNVVLTFIGWSVLIPIIETSFFNGRLLEGLTTVGEKRFKTKINLRKIKINTIIVIGVIAALFTLFHLTAKNMSSIPLLITFVFSVISSILVIRHQELKQAILFHILVNGLAVLSSLGALPFT